MQKYKVTLPEKVKDSVFFKDEGTLKLLSKELVEKIIDEVSEYKIDNVVKLIKKNEEEWTKIRPMKRL